MAFSFEEENFARPASKMPTKSKMANWLVNKGWFKSEKTANIFLLGVVVVCVGLSLVALNIDKLL